MVKRGPRGRPTQAREMTSDNSPSRSLAIADVGGVPATLRPELDQAADYARAEKSTATRRAYGLDFYLFRRWCEGKCVAALPAQSDTVAAFLASEADRGVKPSTIGRRLAAIRYAHKLAGREPPTNSEVVRVTLRGIRRMTGTAPARKTPATADKVLAMVASARSDLKGLRDCALLLLGFAGAFRRSELVALDVADLQFCDGGVRITIRRSKTDQEGLSTTIAIVPGCAACPIRAVRAWINAAKISDGSVFRAVTRNGKISNRRLSGRAVAEVVKKLCAPRGFGGCEF